MFFLWKTKGETSLDTLHLHFKSKIRVFKKIIVLSICFCHQFDIGYWNLVPKEKIMVRKKVLEGGELNKYCNHVAGELSNQCNPVAPQLSN
jgi:hypothetical protein